MTLESLCSPIRADLDYVLEHTSGLWEDLRGARLFISGGTGFFGTWLLESLAWANAAYDLNLTAMVLTRSPSTFLRKVPHLSDNPAIVFQTGDIRDFEFPDGEFSHIIHAAATSATATFHNEDPLSKFDTIIDGTRHILDFAVKCNASKLLYTSSGAVYGKQPESLTHMSENYPGAPHTSDINSVWGVAKRAAEYLCTYYAEKYGVQVSIARCFSFVGPYLPLDIHYAIGNFIRDALNGGPIRVNGDGTPYRSYLYAADLVIWLWTILVKGKSVEIYNVGSEDSLTISELAHIVASCFSHKIEVTVAKQHDPEKPIERYVPSTEKARKRLGIRQGFNIQDSILKTVQFERAITNDSDAVFVPRFGV